MPRLVLLAIFVGALDQTVVAALLPAIVGDFGLPFNRIDDAAWSVTLYLAAYAGVVPFVGRALDGGARGLILPVSLVVFGVGSALCGVAQDLQVLVVGRVVQALGAGALLPVALSYAAQGDPARRLWRLGIVAALAEAGAVCGPIYGAAMLTWFGWRWAFWLNVPLAVVVAIAAACARRGKDSTRSSLAWQSLISPVALGLALGLGVAGLSREATRAATWLPVVCVLGAVAMVAVVAVAEGRLASSAFAMLKTRTLPVVLAAHVLFGVTLVTPLVLVPVWASTLLGLNPSSAAQVLLRLMLVVPPAALVGALIAGRLGRWLVAAGAFGLVVVGLAGMATWPPTVTPDGMTPALIVAGIGFGVLIAPLTDLALENARPEVAASAISLTTAGRVVGMALGLAALTSWGLDQLTRRLAAVPAPTGTGASALQALADYQQALTDTGVAVFGDLFRAAAICALVGCFGLTAMSVARRRQRQRHG